MLFQSSCDKIVKVLFEVKSKSKLVNEMTSNDKSEENSFGKSAF